MDLRTISAISPIDGRYRKQTQSLAPFFSEFGLIHYRVKIEVEYLKALSKLNLPNFSYFNQKEIDLLDGIIRNFNDADALAIKEIEKTTNHDVKAVEYFIKDKLQNLGMEKVLEFVHFGLTSQDINNTAIPLSYKDAFEQVIDPAFRSLTNQIGEISERWENIPMLARTHGQPASPTRLGKEMEVFLSRLTKQWVLLHTITVPAKFGGATGNFNAHYLAYPEVDWHAWADEFVEDILNLDRSFPTTQIEHYDNLAAIFDGFKRISTILIDFSRDMWQYISMNYFKQKIKEGEVGSSAMPHKVNPIDFENAEGNLGVAIALFEHLSAKLPISRLQRDLTDSTVLRNIGVPFAHLMIALASLDKGISKLELNEAAIRADLEDNWAVVAEGIQTILRREGYPQPYEALKKLTRTNAKIDRDIIHSFIETLDVSDRVKDELKKISPFNYTGK
jgi:adenylosuccinate lyase